MSWNELPHDTRAQIKEVLTDRQLEVVKLKLEDYGHERVALALGISPTRAAQLWKRSCQKIEPILRPKRHV